MLRLVHPPPSGGQATRPPKGRPAAALSLTDEEVRHLRAATRNAVKAYGSTAVLAEVIGVPVATIHNITAEKGSRPLGILAIRIARASGMTVEAILGGKLSPVGRCPTCGARVAEGRAS